MEGNNKRAAILLFLILLAGLGVRFYGLGWGLPYHFHSTNFSWPPTAKNCARPLRCPG